MLIIVEGTAGAGKTTLCANALALRPELSLVPPITGDVGAAIATATEAAQGRIVLADSFHATWFVRNPQTKIEDFDAWDGRIAGIPARCVFVRIKNIAARVDADKYGTQFGETDVAIAKYFAWEQERLFDVISKSRVPFVELDGEVSPDQLVADFLARAAEF
ncbi:MAG: hypothetical protein QM831_02610 [Kofleriaceae bacterium]